MLHLIHFKGWFILLTSSHHSVKWATQSVQIPVTSNPALFIMYYSLRLFVLAVFVSFYRCISKISFPPPLSFKLRSVSSQVKGHRWITDRPSPLHQWSRPRSLSLPRGKADQGASPQRGRTSLLFPRQTLSEPTSLKRCLNVKIQVNFDSWAARFRYWTILLKIFRAGVGNYFPSRGFRSWWTGWPRSAGN